MTKLLTGMLLKRVVVGMVVLGSMLGAVPQAAASGEFIRRVDIVEAFSTDVWRVWVPAGASVSVVADGDGDTDLDLFVLDAQSGQLLGSDVDPTDYCIVGFVAYRSGYVQIRIENLGSVWNRYELRVSY